MTHKIGIIGLGGMTGGYHLGCIARDDVPFEAVAAFDIDPERRAFAEEKGLKAYDSLDAFLDSHEFEMVLVGTANNYHCEMVCRALEAGYHVMVEKPAAMSSAELQKMIDTSERVGKLFTVHQNRRWDGDYRMMRQALKENDLGDLYMIESRIHSKNGPGDMYGWRGMEDHAGGMLYDWGVHMLDQLLFMIQEPIKTVYANVFPLRSEEVDDYSKVIITFESGLVAQMEVTDYAPTPLPRWAVYGKTGSMIMEDGSPNFKVRRIAKEEVKTIQAKAFVDYKVVERPQRRHFIEEFEEFEAPKEIPQGGWECVYQNIAGVLEGREELIVKPAQVMRVLKVIEAAFRSSKEGIAVKFDN